MKVILRGGDADGRIYEEDGAPILLMNVPVENEGHVKSAWYEADQYDPINEIWYFRPEVKVATR